MDIWRNLDPRTLGLLLVRAAELTAAQRKARAKQRSSEGTLSAEAPVGQAPIH